LSYPALHPVPELYGATDKLAGAVGFAGLTNVKGTGELYNLPHTGSTRTAFTVTL